MHPHRLYEFRVGTYNCLDKLAMVASTVSSKMIEAMATAEGFKFTDCLTGLCRSAQRELKSVRG